jgi:hypothetical protein
VVEFHRGEAFEDAHRTLLSGVYRFVVTEHGWELEPADQ